MTFHLEAWLDRQVYLPGQTVKCFVRVRRPPASRDNNGKPSKTPEAASGPVQPLNWLAAQLCGFAKLDKRWVSAQHLRGVPGLFVNPPSTPATGSASTGAAPASSTAGVGGSQAGSTALQDVRNMNPSLQCLFASPPTVLDTLIFGTDQETVYLFETNLPPVLPPSYHGTLATYMYAVNISTQRGRHPTRAFKVPVRVQNIPMLQRDLNPFRFAYDSFPFVVHLEKLLSNESQEGSDSPQRNGMLRTKAKSSTRGNRVPGQVTRSKNSHSPFRGLQHLPRPAGPGVRSDDLVRTCQVDIPAIDFDTFSHRQYNIANDGKHIAVLNIAYRGENYIAGSTLTATFDFTKAQVPCHRVLARLYRVERVPSEFVLPSKRSALGPLDDDSEWDGVASETVHWEHTEATVHAMHTHIEFELPADVPSTFQTPLMFVDWHLKMEFTTSPPAVPSKEIDFTAFSYPIQRQVLEFTLPLHVTSPMPVKGGVSAHVVRMVVE